MNLRNTTVKNYLREEVKIFWNLKINRILLFIILALILTMIIFNPILNGIIKPKLLNELNQNKKVNVQIDRAIYNFFSATLSIENLKIEIRDTSETSTLPLKIGIPLLKISGLNTIRLVLGKGFSFNNLFLYNPNIFLSDNHHAKAEDSTSKKNKMSIQAEALKLLPVRLKPLKLGMIKIQNLSFSRIINGKKYHDSLKTFTVQLSNFTFNSSIIEDSLSLKFADDFKLLAEKGSFHLGNDYHIKFDSFSTSSSDSSLEIKNFYCRPYIPDEEYFSHRKFSSDRYIIKFPLLTMNGIDYKKFSWDNDFFIRNIFLNGMDLSICTNKIAPPDISSIPKMPNELMGAAEGKINIDSLELKNWILKIQGRIPEVENYSEVLFTNLNGKIKNISSIRKIQSEKNPCTIKASANLFNAGKLSVEMKLPLLDKDLNFDYSGNLSSMSMLPINKQIQFADKVKLNSGKIDSVDFLVQVRKGAAQVFVNALYRDLKIEKLKSNAEKGGILKKAASFIANTFVMRSSNPDDKKNLKKASIVYIKEKGDTFTDLVWTALKKGIGEIVGF